MRQKRWSCGRVEGWGFLAETGGVAGSVWGMSLLWWWGCGLAGHDFTWNEGFIDFTTQGQWFPNSATSSNLRFGELGLGNVCRLLDSCGLPLWSRVFQTKWITYTTSAGVSTVHFRQSRQPAGTTTRCFGNHDARQTLSWDNLGWNGLKVMELWCFTALHCLTVIPKVTRISPGFSAAIGLWGSRFTFGKTIRLYLEMQYHNRYKNVRWFLLTEKNMCMHACVTLVAEQSGRMEGERHIFWTLKSGQFQS